MQATHQAVVDIATTVQAMAGQVQALTGAVTALAEKVNAPRAIVSRGGHRRLRVGNVEHDIVRAADGTVTLGAGQVVTLLRSLAGASQGLPSEAPLRREGG